MKTKIKPASLFTLAVLMIAGMTAGCSDMMSVYLSTDAEKAAAALTVEDITFAASETSSTITGDFTLPLTGEVEGTAITWTASNTGIVSIADGTATVTQPTDADTEVTLTATISDSEGNTLTKTFVITVLKTSNYIASNIIYALADSGAAMDVIGYESGISGAVTILATADSLPVTTIAANAFENLTTVTSIAIPSSVTTIEAASFKNFSGNITFSGGTGSLTAIGEEAFMSSGITGFSWPAAVTVLPTRVFYNCTSLYFTNVPGGVTEIQSQAMAGLTNPALNGSSVVIPSTLTTLGIGAFQGSNQYGVISFPSGITVVPADTFSGCSALRSVGFLGTLTSIGADAFDNTDLSSGLEFYFSTPPSATVDAFTGVSGVTLHVSMGAAANFSSTPPWDAASGIFSTINDNL